MKTIIVLLLADAVISLICAACAIPLMNAVAPQVAFTTIWLACFGLRQLQGVVGAGKE